MLRLLQILAAVVLVRIVWGVIRALIRPKRPAPEVVRGPGQRELRGEVVGCAHCDLHVPRDEIVTRAGRNYCSPECAAAGPAA